MTDMKPSLLGAGGRKKCICICSHCATIFKGYERWAEKGYQDCPNCKLSGTSIVKMVDKAQLEKVMS